MGSSVGISEIWSLLGCLVAFGVIAGFVFLEKKRSSLRKEAKNWLEMDAIVVERRRQPEEIEYNLKVSYIFKGTEYVEWAQDFLLDEHPSFDGVKSLRPFYVPRLSDVVRIKINPSKPNMVTIVPPPDAS